MIHGLGRTGNFTPRKATVSRHCDGNLQSSTWDGTNARSKDEEDLPQGWCVLQRCRRWPRYPSQYLPKENEGCISDVRTDGHSTWFWRTNGPSEIYWEKRLRNFCKITLEQVGRRTTPRADDATFGFVESTTWQADPAPKMTKSATPKNSAMGLRIACLWWAKVNLTGKNIKKDKTAHLIFCSWLRKEDCRGASKCFWVSAWDDVGVSGFSWMSVEALESGFPDGCSVICCWPDMLGAEGSHKSRRMQLCVICWRARTRSYLLIFNPREPRFLSYREPAEELSRRHVTCLLVPIRMNHR